MRGPRRGKARGGETKRGRGRGRAKSRGKKQFYLITITADVYFEDKPNLLGTNKIKKYVINMSFRKIGTLVGLIRLNNN